jgi:hypothetical protein
MFQLFRTDVKIDQDVAYIATVVHICCNRLSPMFYLFLYTYVASVSNTHLKYFICLLLYVASVAFDVLKVDRDVAHVSMMFELYIPNVSSVFDVYCKCFVWMLQKWIRVLHGTVSGCCCVERGVDAGPYDGRESGCRWAGRSVWGRMRTRERRRCQSHVRLRRHVRTSGR